MEIAAYQSTVDWPLLIAVLIGTGICAGVLAGLLGVGGGIVIVPVLYQAFDALSVDPSVRMHLCVGTSLATIIPTSIASSVAHRRRGTVDTALQRRWAPPLLAGVLIGTLLAGIVSEIVLTTVFAVAALVVSFFMAFQRASWRIAEAVPRGLGGGAVAGAIGLISTLMGIGGGTLSVPVLRLFGVPMHAAVGTAAGFGLLIGLPGAIGMALSGIGNPLLPPWPWTFGYVSMLGLILIFPSTVMAAPWGAALAHALNQTLLQRAFAAFLLITSARMFVNILGL